MIHDDSWWFMILFYLFRGKQRFLEGSRLYVSRTPFHSWTGRFLAATHACLFVGRVVTALVGMMTITMRKHCDFVPSSPIWEFCLVTRKIMIYIYIYIYVYIIDYIGYNSYYNLQKMLSPLYAHPIPAITPILRSRCHRLRWDQEKTLAGVGEIHCRVCLKG